MVSRVSVIVPTFNRAHLLAECLDALLAQTVAPSEIIVVNDGSTDATREVLERYSSRVRAVHKSNGGKASALNVGLSVAAGDPIWIFDDDDLSLPDALEIHLDVLARNPDADFTYSGYHLGVRDPKTGKLEIAATYEAFRGPAKSLFVAFAMGASGPEVGFMLQQGMVVRRRCYDALGPFEESFTHGEDIDMDLRLCRSFKGLRIDEPTFVLRRHAGARGPKSDRYSYEDRDRKLGETDRKVFRKLYETTELAKFLDDGDAGRQGWEGEALVNRALVMAKWGHHDLVMEDLWRLGDLVGCRTVPLNRAILDGLVQVDVTCQRAGSFREAREVRRLMAGLIRNSDDDGTLRNHLTRYYYWKGRERLRQGEWMELVRGVARAARFARFGRRAEPRVNEAGAARP